MADQCCREPSLSQVLTDPVTQVLMRSDGVDPARLCNLIVEARQRIADADRDVVRPEE
jgi:hypothetical protein